MCVCVASSSVHFGSQDARSRGTPSCKHALSDVFALCLSERIKFIQEQRFSDGTGFLLPRLHAMNIFCYILFATSKGRLQQKCYFFEFVNDRLAFLLCDSHFARLTTFYMTRVICFSCDFLLTSLSLPSCQVLACVYLPFWRPACRHLWPKRNLTVEIHGEPKPHIE